GTTQDITALTYVNDSHAWLGTAGGQILSADAGGVFHVVSTNPGSVIEKIAFDPTNTVGYAVSLNGKAFRTLNGGLTWAAVTLPTVHQTCPGWTLVAVSRLFSVAVPNTTTAYLVGGNGSGGEPIVLKSLNANVGAPTWADQNANPAGCRASLDGYTMT